MKIVEILAFRTLQVVSFGIIGLTFLAVAFAILQIATGNYTETSAREF